MMVRIFFAFFLFVIVGGCSINNNVSTFDLNSIDYSVYKDLTIRRRNGAYFVFYKKQLYVIRHSLTQGYVFDKDLDIKLRNKIIKAIEDFDNIDVQAVSVDSLNNICVALSFERNCTNYFYKPANLKYDSIYSTMYSKLDSVWYVKKICAE